jgi:hypothetical protein
MLVRSILAALAVLCASPASGQGTGTAAGGLPQGAWRSPAASTSAASQPAADAAAAAAPAAQPAAPVAKVTSGSGTLPNEQGQLWREYDISPYTLRVTSTNRPEQAIVDWVLRETGYEVWHSEPLAILSVTPRVLRVYHTPEMQAVVAGIVDRFVHSEAETRPFGLRVITLDDPSWRMRAHSIMRPVAAQTPGVLAWLLSKEDAAMLLAEMRRRTDYREHSSPHLLVSSGQSAVVSTMRSRAYIRDVVMRANPEARYSKEELTIAEAYEDLPAEMQRRLNAGEETGE